MRVVSFADTGARRGPGEWFTGVVWMEASPAQADTPDAGIFRVSFEPGARTNWHSHPEGQILHIVTGTGRVRREGGPLVEVTPGDVVYFAPGERHWHGAAPNSPMVHLAINPAAGSGGGTDWQEPVTDREYGAEE